jgi:predicted TPR repeat methyltransferase
MKRPAGRSGGPPPGGFDWPQAISGVMAVHRQGRLAEAEPIYRHLLAMRPDDPNLNHFLGVLLHQRGRTEEAFAQVRRSIELDPCVAAWHNNLGNLLLDRRQYADAAKAYQRCLELDPANSEVRNNLGCLLRLCGQLAQAEAVLLDAVERAPASSAAFTNLALVLAGQGRDEEAMAAGNRALELKPDNPRSRRLLGLLYARRGRLDLAAEVFRDWLARSPDDPQALHHLAAVTGHEVPDRASDQYVTDLFDRFAASFDARLSSLDYQAPALCLEVVRRRLGEPRGRRRVLDAGCGTGLCGPLLRPYARELVGVDLSRGMLDRARARSVYDVLEPGELGAWIAADRPRFDLIVSADTLCYFGALDKLLADIRRASADDGWVVFTVEALADASSVDCRLLPHGRYAHRREAIERWLREAGWGAIEVESVVLRQEAGEPVRGWLASAKSDYQA